MAKFDLATFKIKSFVVQLTNLYFVKKNEIYKGFRSLLKCNDNLYYD